MDIINIVFKPYIDIFVIVFMDDITIYSRYEEDHASHLRVVETLKDIKFDPSLSKSKFLFDVVVFSKVNLSSALHP